MPRTSHLCIFPVFSLTSLRSFPVPLTILKPGKPLPTCTQVGLTGGTFAERMKNECNANKNNDNEQEGISARVSIRAVSVGFAQDETKARSGVRLGEAFVHM